MFYKVTYTKSMESKVFPFTEDQIPNLSSLTSEDHEFFLETVNMWNQSSQRMVELHPKFYGVDNGFFIYSYLPYYTPKNA